MPRIDTLYHMKLYIFLYSKGNNYVRIKNSTERKKIFISCAFYRRLLSMKKKCLPSLATREMKMEIALRFCLIAVRVLVKNNKCLEGCMERRTLDTAGGNVN